MSDDEIGPGTDVHNIRPADRDRNTERLNRKFTDGSGNSGIVSSNGGWYPGDEWKGDVARIVMYMYMRYHGSGTQISQTNCYPYNVGFGTENAMDPNMIDLFLKWNVEDPVSDFEANRNEVLAGIQLNRNPFIDNPYLATLIWGGLNAEDKWWSSGTSDNEAPSVPLNLVASNITDESFEISWSESTDNIAVYDYLVYVDDVYVGATTSTTILVEDLNPETTYSVKVKARDASNNSSELSSVLSVSTLEGPLILLFEDFEDCNALEFFSYSEASLKDWTCNDAYGENNSGSIDVNGYEEAELSKDWLITNNAIDFDINDDELLSFYIKEKYGSTPLELLYSSDYDGSSDPSNYTWTAVPNVTIPVPVNDTNNVDEIYTFSDVDISSITGSVYIAFKYYSNGEPTRWTVDNFEISAVEPNGDNDGDGVLNSDDLCPNTPIGEVVDSNGCSEDQRDDDEDGVANGDDLCANTPSGEDVNSEGCSDSQIDDDEDGVMNNVDLCPNTPTGEVVDSNGCSEDQRDDDEDGVANGVDICPNTPAGEAVNNEGCSDSQIDDDEDGVMNNVDICANTPSGEDVDSDGCSDSQLDDDGDGVMNNVDACPGTTDGAPVNSVGCFTLASNNFSIESIGETCDGLNNGELLITATSDYNYAVDVNGTNYNFTNSITISDLEPGNYSVCISVVNENYEQCFNLEIEAAEEISGKVSVTSGKVAIEIENGTAPYSIIKNGVVVFETSNKSILVENIKNGDVVEVKSSIACEGVLSKTIDSFNNMVAYPNPTKGMFEIGITGDNKTITVELYNMQSQLINLKECKVEFGKVQMDIQDQPSGIYFVKVISNDSKVLRIIKE